MSRSSALIPMLIAALWPHLAVANGVGAPHQRSPLSQEGRVQGSASTELALEGELVFRDGRVESRGSQSRSGPSAIPGFQVWSSSPSRIAVGAAPTPIAQGWAGTLEGRGSSFEATRTAVATTSGARLDLQGRATLLALHARTAGVAFGPATGSPRLTLAGHADVLLGADLVTHAEAALGTGGASGSVTAGAFVGGRSSAEIAGTLDLCGVVVSTTAEAEASYGLGARASGRFAADFVAMEFRLGGRVALTAGIGAGAGADVSISLAEVLRDPAASALCARQTLSQVATGTGRVVARAANAAGARFLEGARALCFLCPRPASDDASVPGFNGPRRDSTDPASARDREQAPSRSGGASR